MTQFKAFAVAALLAVAASPALAQSSMSNAQCDTMMMVGTQNYAPSAVAGCTAYFQSLADGAVATGTFATVRPQTGALTVAVSTSASGD